MSAMFGLSACILAAAAFFVLKRIPADTLIPIDWAKSLNLRAEPPGTWALFIAPGVLVLFGIFARLIKGWLPQKSRRRRIIWYFTIGLILVAIVFQYVLIRDAFHAAASR